MDVVLCCHGLYSMTENDRMKFIESCINSLINLKQRLGEVPDIVEKEMNKKWSDSSGLQKM